MGLMHIVEYYMLILEYEYLEVAVLELLDSRLTVQYMPYRYEIYGFDHIK